MSITAKENPRYYSGPGLELDTHLAVDSKTWIAGQFAALSSTGKVQPLATTATKVYGVFGDEQSTATSSSKVKVWKITSPETAFVGYVSNVASDIVASVSLIGGAGARVTSGIFTCDVNNDTAAYQLVKITDVLFNKEGFKNASTDNPGQVIFKIKDASNIQG